VRARLLLVAIAAALVLPAASAAQRSRPAAPAQRDWTQVVVATPEGGYRMGNPAASIMLVEYGSISCPHCAAFAAEGAPTVEEQLVRTGRASWEYRPYLLFPTDPGIFMLLRCQGPAGFFPTMAELYSTQRSWFGRVQAYVQGLSQEERQRLEAAPVTQRIAALTRASGVDEIFRRRGMSVGRIDACLSDQAGLDALLATTQRGSSQFQVQGTPTFLLNGRKLDGVYDWASLRPHLPVR